MSRKILDEVIDPTLKKLESHKIPYTNSARSMLYAIGLQESGLQYRYQKTQSGVGKGPARGLWQFESDGGVKGVLDHKKSSDLAKKFAQANVGSTDPQNVWKALEFDDVLACVFARLLLWVDTRPLPAPTLAYEQEAWACYLRTWRPGKPHPAKWSSNWRAAVEILIENGGS